MSSKSKLALLTVVLVALTSFASVPTASAVCGHYENSIITYYDDYGYACAGEGPGCTECVDEGSGASCVTNGRACTPFKA